MEKRWLVFDPVDEEDTRRKTSVKVTTWSDGHGRKIPDLDNGRPDRS